MEQPSTRSLANELNEHQFEAVTYCDGPALVIAGAGSGKTRVLTFKIAYLLQLGYQPWNILSLTFTNKAAREMNTRIAQIVGDELTRDIWSGTFHSIFGRILRKESEYIGFTSNFTIYDTTDSRSLIKTIIKEMGLDNKKYKPNYIHSIISNAKNRLILPEVYAADSETQRLNDINNIRKTSDIYKEYFIRCQRSNAMDFDDLLLYTFLLFRDNPQVLKRYQNRFQYILVDEYQDTNYAQHKIITQIAPSTAKIFVVGDDAQSIYSFRGANIENILRFNEQYPTAHLIKLERNYRSTQNIVNAANSIIQHNTSQIPKAVYSENEKGQKITVISSHSDREESTNIVGEIKHLLRQYKLNYDQIAILYRTNAQSRALEETFRKNNIPCRIYGGLSFYQRKEIKDFLAYLRIITNPNDDEALKRIINYPTRGIGDTTVNKLVLTASEYHISLWKILEDPIHFGISFNKGTLSKLFSFRELIVSFINYTQDHSAYDVAYKVLLDSGIFTELNSQLTVENTAKKENLDELLNSIKIYQDEQLEETGNELVRLSNYLSQVSLLSDTDEQDSTTSSVTLMTIHAAKGLEFDAVFITGMEEDLFPSSSAKFYRQEMEEERRLFYVAVTRAKRFCYLTYAKSRYKFGSIEFGVPSSFIKEIEPEFLCYAGSKTEVLSSDFSPPTFFTDIPTTKIKINEELKFSSQVSSPSTITHLKRLSPSSTATHSSVETLNTSEGNLIKGTRIEHARFGEGTIIHLELAGDSSKITVHFDSGDTKNLLLKFAKFRVLK